MTIFQSELSDVDRCHRWIVAQLDVATDVWWSGPDVRFSSVLSRLSLETMDSRFFNFNTVFLAALLNQVKEPLSL